MIVLPNDSDTQLAAEAAARAAADEGIEVHVVPLAGRGAGPGRARGLRPRPRPAANLLAMSRAAAATRHGAVAVASREALTERRAAAIPATSSGVVDGDVVIVGTDLARGRRRGASSGCSAAAASC